MLGGVFNTFPYTAFAQNVGLVSITGVRSRFVATFAGAVLILLGLTPKMGAIVEGIPQPVLGGAGIALFGMVAASGVRTLSTVRVQQPQHPGGRDLARHRDDPGRSGHRSTTLSRTGSRRSSTPASAPAPSSPILLNLLLNSDKQRAKYEAEEDADVSAHDAVRENPQVEPIRRGRADPAAGGPRYQAPR